jgi:hypothetical protein
MTGALRALLEPAEFEARPRPSVSTLIGSRREKPRPGQPIMMLGSAPNGASHVP